MKKTLAILLAILMVTPLFTVLISAVPEEATGGPETGLTISGDGSLAEEEDYAVKALEQTPHTFSAWVYLPGGDTADTLRWGVILGNYTGVSTESLPEAHLNFEIQTGRRPRLQWYDEDGDTHQVVFSETVPVDAWTQVVIVHDEEAEELRCYLNGELVQSGADTSYAYAPIDPTAIDMPMMLGGDHRNTQSPQYFKGGLKDVCLYSDVRTAAEIKNDYENGVDLADSDLLCAYDIDASDRGKDIADESGNGYHMGYSKVWMTEAEMEALREEDPDREYSFAVIGDTQYTTRYHPDNLAPIYDWIVANKEGKNIQYVMGLGDITDTDTDAEGTSANGAYEWTVAYNAISKLNGVVDYSLVRGNHDVKTGGASFLQYFGGDSLYAKQFTAPDGYEAGYYEGTFINYGKVEETGTISNSWRTLDIGGDKWLLVNLDYGVGNDVLEWAGEVIDRYPDRRVIVTTHGYLFADGTPIDNNDLGTVTSTTNYSNGDAMWENLMSRHKNIELVLCGHVYYNNIVVARDKGVYGNTVAQMLIDAQSIDRTLGGLGMVAMFYISEDGQNISVEYYSTVKGMYFRGRNQLEIDLDTEGKEADRKWDGSSYFKPTGSGTEADPYIVTCAENLNWMSRKIGTGGATGLSQPFDGCYFEQICDIDLNGHTLSSIGYYYSSGTKMYPFGGKSAGGATYDGNGFRIFNGSVANPNQSHGQNINWGAGIFGFVYDGVIKNVVADRITAYGSTSVGIIAGRVGANAEILNCVVTDTCKVIGTGDYSTIDSSVSQFNVTAQNRLGGIVGHAANTAVRYCVSNATIYTNGNYALAGGVVGSIEKATNITYCTFGGRIINDFTDSSYNRVSAGENVNGGILGYAGSGSYTPNGNRFVQNCINTGGFTVVGTATHDIVYGGIVGATKELPSSMTAMTVAHCYNLNPTVTLGEQTVAVYAAGIVGRATQNADHTAKSLTLNSSYSVPLTEWQGVKVDTDAYTVSELYIAQTVAEGATAALTASSASVKEEQELRTQFTDALEKTVKDTQLAERRTEALKTVGYQRAVEDGDYRIRVVFGLDTLELDRYGFELTLTYTENGETVRRTASLTDQVVYREILGYPNGVETPYNAKTYCGSEYFVTLVIDPTIGDRVIGGEAVCTITAYTLDHNGNRFSYGADLISLTFVDGVMTLPRTNIE